LLTRNRPLRRSAGFTLIELMVSLAAMFIIVGYLMGTFTFQHQTYVVVDQVSEAQQNTRAIAALLERDVRNAGYMVPPAGATCGIDNDDSPDIFFVSDADAIRPIDELGAVLAGQKLGTSQFSRTGTGSVVFTVNDVVIDGEATYDTDGNGSSDSDFQINGGAILVDTANLDRGVLCGTVTGISATLPQQLTVNFSPGAETLAGLASNAEQIVLIPAHVYSVTSDNPPELHRNGQLLAKDVEDLQMAWFFDTDLDGQTDAAEYRGESASNSYDSEAQNGNELREVRVNLVLRTRDDDPRNPNATGTGQGTENRVTAIPGDDGRRRRIHTGTVRVRNVPAS
jgi:prepilin-type N-terminal cleavage/methylation domain-containing protein